jgi:SHS2 domain-containing protein
MSYTFLDHTADIAVEVSGESLEELFLSSASAWKESVVEQKEFSGVDTKNISISGESIEILLVQFLSELNYFLLTKKWLTDSIGELEINEQNGRYHLNAKIYGEDLNPSVHSLKVEIKAITFHQIEIKKKKNEFSTTIVFDI